LFVGFILSPFDLIQYFSCNTFHSKLDIWNKWLNSWAEKEKNFN
jgi:hypothetical protein